MVKKYGTYPANARVDVDYSKGKPKIKFTYPRTDRSAEEQAFDQSFNGIHSKIIVGFAFVMLILVVNTDWGTKEYPQNCEVSLDKHQLSILTYVEFDRVNSSRNTSRTWIRGANFSCDNGLYQVAFSRGNNLLEPLGFLNEDSDILRAAAIFSLIWVFGLMVFLSVKYSTKWLIKQKWYQKWFPVFQAEGIFKNKTKRYIKFKKEDVENKIVEIPVFSNVVLDYATSGDFSKQLQRIKIKEHRDCKYKKGRVGKMESHIFDWYARFYFKEKPKSGCLEVIFI